MIGSNPHYSYSSGATTTAALYTQNPYTYVSGTPITTGTLLTQTPGLSLNTVTIANISTAPVYNFTLPIISGVIDIKNVATR
jgi:hypothetical protein